MNNPKSLSKETSAEILPPEQAYPLLASDRMARVLRQIDENLDEKSVLNLSRIKVPSGGDTDFKVEMASGVERHASLIGIITSFRTARVYWKMAYGTGQGTQPPDCSSKDGFRGEGDPGGDCTRCPFAQFKTARRADGAQAAGQACKEVRQVLFLLPGQTIPHLLAVPPTSLAAFTKYSINVMSQSSDCWEVITKLTLEPAMNAGGVNYARIRFTLYGSLGAEEAKLMAPYHERMRNLLAPMVVDHTAYEIVEEPEAARPTGAPAPPETEQLPGQDDIPF